MIRCRLLQLGSLEILRWGASSSSPPPQNIHLRRTPYPGGRMPQPTTARYIPGRSTLHFWPVHFPLQRNPSSSIWTACHGTRDPPLEYCSRHSPASAVTRFPPFAQAALKTLDAGVASSGMEGALLTFRSGGQQEVSPQRWAARGGITRSVHPPLRLRQTHHLPSYHTPPTPPHLTQCNTIQVQYNTSAVLEYCTTSAIQYWGDALCKSSHGVHGVI